MKERTHERIYYWANSALLEITDKTASAVLIRCVWVLFFVGFF